MIDLWTTRLLRIDGQNTIWINHPGVSDTKSSFIAWCIVEYDSANKQEQYWEPLRNRETNCQWKLE